MTEILNQILNIIIEYAILLFEYTGVIIIIIACLRGIWEYVHCSPVTRLNLAKGMAMGLEFKLGSEILRTVVVREFKEIFIVASIISLRALLTFLIHWEIKNEESATPDEKNSK
ncbi:MAG: DUF1622 domain-containing protein [Lachnospiraceae bacterium]|nr:DUF1622 domain-containing protein [Lachnospiraceae bacterium]